MNQPYTSQIYICESDFDVAEQYKAACEAAPHSGAVVFFVGLVRDMYSGRDNQDSVEYLELQHYPVMTESLCEEIVHEAHQRYSFEHVRLIHRVGKLYSSEQIVMVAVASKHREGAFLAAQFVMDHLKTRATFWKKEVGTLGAQWLGVKDKDEIAVKRWD